MQRPTMISLEGIHRVAARDRSLKRLRYVHVVVVGNGKRTVCDALTRSSLSRISASGRGRMVSDVSVLAEVSADSLGQSHRSSTTDRRLVAAVPSDASLPPLSSAIRPRKRLKLIPRYG